MSATLIAGVQGAQAPNSTAQDQTLVCLTANDTMRYAGDAPSTAVGVSPAQLAACRAASTPTAVAQLDGAVRSLGLLFAGPVDHRREFGVDARYDFSLSIGRTYLAPLLDASLPIAVGIFVTCDEAHVQRWQAFLARVPGVERLVAADVRAPGPPVPRSESYFRRAWAFGRNSGVFYSQYAHLSQTVELLLGWEHANGSRIAGGQFDALLKARNDFIMHPAWVLQPWWLHCASNATVLYTPWSIVDALRFNVRVAKLPRRHRQSVNDQIMLGRRTPMLTLLRLVRYEFPARGARAPMQPRIAGIERIIYSWLVGAHLFKLQPIELPLAAVGRKDGRVSRKLPVVPDPPAQPGYADTEASICWPEALLTPDPNTWST